MVERGPEKAGVGSPILSLGTIFFLQVPIPKPTKKISKEIFECLGEGRQLIKREGLPSSSLFILLV